MIQRPKISNDAITCCVYVRRYEIRTGGISPANRSLWGGSSYTRISSPTLIKLVAEYDPILRNHLSRAQAHHCAVVYLSPTVQNQFNGIIAENVRSELPRSIKKKQVLSYHLQQHTRR